MNKKNTVRIEERKREKESMIELLMGKQLIYRKNKYVAQCHPLNKILYEISNQQRCMEFFA